MSLSVARLGHCKPDEQYDLIEACSWGPYLELFARGTRPGWTYWGDQADDSYVPTWKTYAHNSQTENRSGKPAARKPPARRRIERQAELELAD